MRKIQWFWLPALVTVLISVPTVQANTITFNFNGDPTGEATPLTDNIGILSATFTSSGDPGGFEVFPSFFYSLTGQVLLDPASSGPNNATLTVLFNYAATAVSLDFATYSSTAVPFDLSAYNGTTLVGSTNATGSIPQGYFNPEGVISFSGAGFDEVVLSAPAATAFAIDNLAVTTSIPEPGTFSLLLAAAAVLVLTRYLALGRIARG
jgi:hypothetical protein